MCAENRLIIYKCCAHDGMRRARGVGMSPQKLTIGVNRRWMQNVFLPLSAKLLEPLAALRRRCPNMTILLLNVKSGLSPSPSTQPTLSQLSSFSTHLVKPSILCSLARLLFFTDHDTTIAYVQQILRSSVLWTSNTAQIVLILGYM
jgi:hypothetical protein